MFNLWTGPTRYGRVDRARGRRGWSCRQTFDFEVRATAIQSKCLMMKSLKNVWIHIINVNYLYELAGIWLQCQQLVSYRDSGGRLASTGHGIYYLLISW